MKLADRQIMLEYVDHGGRRVDGGWGLDNADFDAFTTLIGGQPRLPSAAYRLDAAVLVHDIRQAARLPFTTAQLLTLLGALDEWATFSDALVTTVDAALQAVQGVVTGMGQQRTASIGVGGRLLWGICSLTIPPPVGVALGALSYAAIEDTWTDGFQRLTEWTLQMPMVFDASDNVLAPSYANRYGAGNTNRFPAARNPGGQEKVKDLKDFNQMGKGVEKLFGGDRRALIDRYNSKTLTSLWGLLPKAKAQDGDELKQLFRRGCELAKQALRDGVEGLVSEYLNSGEAATRIVLASARVQDDALASAPAHRAHDIVRSGAELYINTLVHRLFSDLLARARHHRAPAFGSSEQAPFQRNIEKYLLAKYFVDITTPPQVAMIEASRWNVQRLDRYQADRWAKSRGTVPEKVFAPTVFSQATRGFVRNGIDGFFASPMEKKLLDLDILRKVSSEAAVAAWVPGSDAVLYHSLDFAARGRIAEWAARYLSADPVSALSTSFMKPAHAVRARPLLSRAPFTTPLP